jgi:hypothetical protein
MRFKRIVPLPKPPGPEPGSFVGSGQGRALTGISSKGLRAVQSGGKEPGAFKPTKKGPPV